MRAAGILVVLVAAALARAAAAQEASDAVQNQWFTGSLVAPSPAIPKAGVFAIEPYAIYTGNTGAYESDWQHRSVSNNTNQLLSVTLLKYAITDKLSVQAIPSFAYQWNGQTTSSGAGVGDLPIEFDYRLKDQDNRTGSPSVTVDLGMSFPTGEYDHLSRSLNGLGSGAYTAKEGLLLQSLFDTWGDHPMRLRLFGAAFEPLAKVSVQDASVYGTGQGFQGQATPGFAAQLGLGIEYGLDQRWVLALDLVDSYADGFRLDGTSSGNIVHTSAASSTSLALAPAIEYNWSDSVGLIVGVEFSAAGRNTASFIAPQIALSLVF